MKLTVNAEAPRKGGCSTSWVAWGFTALIVLGLLHLGRQLVVQQGAGFGQDVAPQPSPPSPRGLRTLWQQRTAEEALNASEPLPSQRMDLVDWVRGVATLQDVAALQELRMWLDRSRGDLPKITHTLEKEAAGFGWTTCATEGELCVCPSGDMRYGDPEHNLWVQAYGVEGSRCSTAAFHNKDVAPGMVKSCQCLAKPATCPDGSAVDWARCPGDGQKACRAGCSKLGLAAAGGGPQPRSQLCRDERAYELLWSCDRLESRVPDKGHAHGEPQEVLEHAIEQACADEALRPQFETYLDCEFVDAYLRWTTNQSEWLDEAYLTYVAGKKDSKYEWQATNLVRSVALFSSRPIVVVVVGDAFVPPMSWHHLLNVIVYRIHPIPSTRVSFNFNKLRAMVAARAVVGIQLDTDQIIFTGMDRVFKATRREINAQYPWPMLPVHWMSRDAYPGSPYLGYAFKLYEGRHTMRWGHAHPTWSYWALPFLCDLLLERLRAEVPDGKRLRVWNLSEANSIGLLEVLRRGDQSRGERPSSYKGWMIEDEDMLNVALWRDGVDKAWCKFDLEPDLFLTRFGLDQKMYNDPQWYPDGVPLLFLSSHNTKNFETTDWLLAVLSQCARRPQGLRCSASKGDHWKVCKVSSKEERAARRWPAEYLGQVCCCIEPRQSRPVFWHGQWYTSGQDVPLTAPGGTGVQRHCVMP